MFPFAWLIRSVRSRALFWTVGIAAAPILAGMAFVTSSAVLIAQADAPKAPKQKTASPEEEFSFVTDSLIKTVTTADKETLLATPGFKPDVVERIMAHRAAGKSFESLVHFRKVTKIASRDFNRILERYQATAMQQAVARGRRPVPDPKRPGSAGDLQKPKTPEGSQQPSAAGPIGRVRPGYFANLPGYDHLDELDPLHKKAFLETINREHCSCGCLNETLAFCLVNDPGCPVVKARVKKIYDDITTKPPR